MCTWGCWGSGLTWSNCGKIRPVQTVNRSRKYWHWQSASSKLLTEVSQICVLLYEVHVHQYWWVADMCTIVWSTSILCWLMCRRYVYYCMKYINTLLSFGIKPIMVFDGCRLPSKQEVEKSRREYVCFASYCVCSLLQYHWSYCHYNVVCLLWRLRSASIYNVTFIAHGCNFSQVRCWWPQGDNALSRGCSLSFWSSTPWSWRPDWWVVSDCPSRLIYP